MSLQAAVVWFFDLPLRYKILAFASAVVLVELAFRRLAPKSRAYARWTAFFQGIGQVWTAVLLAIVYIFSGRARRPGHAPHRPRPARPAAPPRAHFLARARAEPARPRAIRPAPVLMASPSTYVLGISCFYHDSAAALLKDGVVIAAGQEERFSRKRHDSDFPAKAIQYVLHEAGILPEELDAVGFYDKPLLKFERMLSTYVATFPRSFNSFRKAMPIWLHEKLWVPSIIRKELKPYKGPIYFAEHHMSHAASCFLPSPFEEAAILTVDGVGEWATASYGVGKGTDVTMLKEIRFPHSLGLLYSAFTYYLGFKVNSAEYKVMGLAPYGKPVHFDRIMKEMVHLKEDGSFKLDMRYFAYDHGLRMTNGAFDEFFGGPPRKPETWMAEREFDIAASVQRGVRGGGPAHGAPPPRADRPHEALHGRRGRPQLRGQRPGHPRDPDEGAVGPARGRRRGGRGGRRPLPLQHDREAPAREGLDARLPRPAVHRRRDRPVPRRGGSEVHDPHRSRPAPADGEAGLGRPTSSAGSRAGWSSVPGRWARAASWPTRGTRRCATPST